MGVKVDIKPGRQVIYGNLVITSDRRTSIIVHGLNGAHVGIAGIEGDRVYLTSGQNSVHTTPASERSKVA